jgi:hypothetical protein
MAFLLPLIAGLAGPVLSGIASAMSGKGGKMRRGAKSRAAVKKLLMSRTAGGALAVMNKYPLLSRPHKYAHGGALAVMNKYPLLSRPHAYATGGRVKRRGHGVKHTAAAVLSKLAESVGPAILAAHGQGMVRPHKVRSHKRVVGGRVIHVRGHAKGYGAMPPSRHVRAHHVRPHVSHTKYGAPIMVKGYIAGSGAVRRQKGHGMFLPRAGIIM